MAKYLLFITKQSSVAQTVFKKERFEEKLSFHQNLIFKAQPTLKELSNLKILTKIIRLDLVRSDVFTNFLIIEKNKGCN